MTVACVADFVKLAQRDLSQPEAGELSDEDLAQVMTMAVRLYAARSEARDNYLPALQTGEVTATDVAITASEMIRAVDINLFDLSMWHGRPRNHREG
jgi:hypothetical protein